MSTTCGGCSRGGGRRTAAGHHRHDSCGRRERRGGRRRPALRRRRGAAGLRLDGLGDADIARGLRARHAGHLRDDAAGGHDPHPLEAHARGGVRARRGHATSTSCSHPSGCSPDACSPTCASTRSCVGGLSRPARPKAEEFYEPVLAVRRAARPAAPERRVGPRQRRGRRDGQAGGDHLPRREHRPRQPVRARSRPRTASTSTRSSRPATPSPTATSTARASPWAATASRSTRASTCGTTRMPRSCAQPARPTPPCRHTRSGWPPRRPEAASRG